MCSAVGISYAEVMDLPMDEFLKVRQAVVKIGEEQKALMQRAKRG